MPSLFDSDGPDGLPQTARSGIYYEIESCTVRDNWVPRANQTTVNCRIAYAGSGTWITDMVGRVYTTTGTGGVGRILRRDLPEQSPYPPPQPLTSGDVGGQWCTRVEQIDQGGDPFQGAFGPRGPTRDAVTGWPVPLWSRYRATFEGLPFAILDDLSTDTTGSGPRGAGKELKRYVIRSRRPKTREQQLPLGGWWIIPYGNGSTGKKLPGASWFKRIIQADVQYVWVRVPVQNLPVSNLRAALNTVNDLTWDTVSGGYNWDPGTLLFVGWDDSDRYFDANGDWVCDVVYYFEHKDLGPLTGVAGGGGFHAGWNSFLNNVGDPIQVSDDGTPTGNLPYEISDFNQLFTVQ